MRQHRRFFFFCVTLISVTFVSTFVRSEKFYVVISTATIPRSCPVVLWTGKLVKDFQQPLRWCRSFWCGTNGVDARHGAKIFAAMSCLWTVEEVGASCRKITPEHVAPWLSPGVQNTMSEFVILFSVPDFARILTHCRITETFETVEPLALTTRPDY